jgi:phosphoribosylformimino-5-aminoimidazole carboxamide ribotide isomerase
MVAGWTEETGRDAVSLARWFYNMGLRWLIVTDVARDGMPAGIDLPGSLTFTQATGLHVITAGGANSLEDVRAACQSKLAGIVVGRALYDGTIDPAELFALTQDTRPC